MTAPAPARPGWEVVTAARDGDADAFVTLWETNRHLVGKVIRDIVRDPGTADDLTSETFIRAWKALDRTEDLGYRPSAWLCRIGRNLALDYVKAPKNRLTVAMDLTDDLDEDGARPPGWVAPYHRARMWGSTDTESAERASGRAGDLDALAAYVDRLNPYQRAVIRLRFFEDKSIAQTAQELGTAAGTVRSAQHRAVARLREMMAWDDLRSAGDFTIGSAA